MLTGPEELERLRAGEGVPTSSVPGFIERVDFEAESPSLVVKRARAVLEAVVQGFEEGLDPGSAEWIQRLPGWFVAACTPEPTAAEREEWLVRWRALDREERVRAEAELGWTLEDWLAAAGPLIRPWRWWAYDGKSVLVLVDGWPSPLESLAWLLEAAGAGSLRWND